MLVSDNLTHAKETVVPYISCLLDDLPSGVKTVSIWSDGPTFQFKNRFILASFPVLENKYNVKITLNIFVTSHGDRCVSGVKNVTVEFGAEIKSEFSFR